MFGALTRRAGAVAVAQGAAAAGAVATDAVLAWRLSQTENGLLQVVLMVARFATLAGALGIPTSLYFLFPRTGEGRRRHLAGQSLAGLVMSGLIAAGVVASAAPALAGWLGEPPHVAALLRAGCFLIALALPALLAEPLLIVQERAWLAAGNALAGAVVQVALVTWAVSGKHGLESVLYALTAAQGIRLLFPLLFSVGNLPAPATVAVPAEGGLLRAQAAVALPIAMTAVIDAASAYADRAIVAHSFPAADLALYRYGAQEVPFIGLLIGALTPVLLPQFSAMLRGGKHGEVLQLWHRAAEKTAVVLFGIFWALIWVAPEFLSVLYSPAYGKAAVYFRIYLLLLPLRVVAFLPMLFALGRGRFAAGVAAAEVVLSIGVSVSLIPVLGMAGAAVGPVLSTAVQAGMYLTVIRTGLQASWGNVLPWRQLAGHFMKAGLFFTPLAILTGAPLSPAVLVAGAVAWGCVYLILMALPRLRAAQLSANG